MKKLIKSFDDFVNESYIINEGDDKATVTPIGDTGISLVTFPENTSFSAPDNKPYILLLSDNVEFQANLNNKTVTVELTSDDMEPSSLGAWRREVDPKKEDLDPKGNRIAASRTPDMKTCINVLEQATAALYGEFQVKKENVGKLVKAMRILDKDQKVYLAKNSIFNTIYKNIKVINGNYKTPQDLATAMKGKTSYTAEIFDGIKLGMKA
jgi:hypothetical protein